MTVGQLINRYPELYTPVQVGYEAGLDAQMTSIARELPPETAVMMLVFLLFYPLCRASTRESVCLRTSDNPAALPYWAAIRLADCCFESKPAYDGLQTYIGLTPARELFIMLGSDQRLSRGSVLRNVKTAIGMLERQYHWSENVRPFVDTDVVRAYEKASRIKHAHASVYLQ